MNITSAVQFLNTLSVQDLHKAAVPCWVCTLEANDLMYVPPCFAVAERVHNNNDVESLRFGLLNANADTMCSLEVLEKLWEPLPVAAEQASTRRAPLETLSAFLKSRQSLQVQPAAAMPEAPVARPEDVAASASADAAVQGGDTGTE